MKTTIPTCSVIATVCLSSSSNAFRNGRIPPRHTGGQSSPTAREYKSSSSLEGDESRRIARQIQQMSSSSSPMPHNHSAGGISHSRTSLSVATLEGSSESGSRFPDEVVVDSLISNMNLPVVARRGNLLPEDVIPVLSASLLVTGNTVGSSMFVLPEAVRGVGLAWGSAIFLGLYVYNLISGLLLADVAISLHESSECEVPGSFKDFVDTALRSDAAGTLTAGASLLSNGCFLAYGAVAAGSLLADTFPGRGLDPVVGTVAFAAIISLFATTQSNAGLERIANAVVMVVFSSFAALLMPSIANVSDPVGTFLAPGTNPGGLASAVGSAVPLLLSSLMYQNIVPSITKLLDFDRAKTTAAIAIGSLIPMGMYIAWCYAALGGGLDGTTASGAGAAAFTAFSASALFVSCLTAVMSLAEEYESLLFSRTEEDEDGDCPISNRFSIPAVAASVMPPVALALAFAEGGDLTGALHFNGAFIVPFLYGLLPIILYRSVRQYQLQDSAISISSLPQVLLGAGTVCALGQEMVQYACTYS